MTTRTPTNGRSIPTPIRSTPSSAPYEAMAVSQQTHIDDLVQKNRTLDHVAKKLKEELLAEQARSKEAAKAIKAQWQEESAEWREGCESLQACHRIAHLRTLVELDKERLAMVKEKDVARRERIATLQRDYRITMFQVRESQLEGNIEELEEEVQDSQARAEEDTVALMAEYEETLENLRVSVAEYAAEAKRITKEYKTIEKEKDKLETKHARLREEHAELAASAASTTSKLERSSLQLDGAQTEISELQRLNDEYKRNNAELKRQMDKWQNLETKGGAEVENLRKRRVELEVLVKELENRLEDSEGQEEQLTKALEKEKKRVERLKESIDPWKEEAEHAQELANQHEAEATDAVKHIAKLEKRILKLQDQLEAERKNAKKTKQTPIRPAEDTVDESSDHEEEPVKAVPAKTRRKARPKTHDGSDTEDKRTKAGPSGTRKQDLSEAEEKTTSEKAKGKRKARDDDETEAAEPEKKGRRKAAEDEATSAKPRSRGAAKVNSDEVDGSKPKKAKSASRSEPKPAHVEDEDAVEDDAAPKKKKRKINIFPPSQPTSFPWGQLPQGDGGLNIPTVLSPVKDSELALQRPSMLGRVSSMLSFGSR